MGGDRCHLVVLGECDTTQMKSIKLGRVRKNIYLISLYA